MTFLEQVVAGTCAPDTVDDWVEAWHEGAGLNQSLAEYLGFTDEQYSRWAMNPKALTQIIAEYGRT